MKNKQNKKQLLMWDSPYVRDFFGDKFEKTFLWNVSESDYIKAIKDFDQIGVHKFMVISARDTLLCFYYDTLSKINKNTLFDYAVLRKLFVIIEHYWAAENQMTYGFRDYKKQFEDDSDQYFRLVDGFEKDLPLIYDKLYELRYFLPEETLKEINDFHFKLLSKYVIEADEIIDLPYHRIIVHREQLSYERVLNDLLLLLSDDSISETDKFIRSLHYLKAIFLYLWY